MSTLAQTDDGGIQLSGGRTTLVTDPIQAGAIKLRNRFKIWRGEWFRDTRVGLPWLQSILVKNPDLSIIRTIFREVIVSTPPFVDVRDLVATLNPKTRRLDCSFVAVADPDVAAGATVTAETLEKPFIVNLPSETA